MKKETTVSNSINCCEDKVIHLKFMIHYLAPSWIHFLSSTIIGVAQQSLQNIFHE